MGRTASVVVVAALLTPAVAAADSDGYYCAGPGYVAYETRFSTPSAGHLLHVVRFSRSEGIVALDPIALEDFQVRGMTCGETVIQLTGGRTEYAVDITNPHRPDVRGTPATSALSGAGAANLGHWSREGVIDLESDAEPGTFQLVISRVDREVNGGIEHYTISRVIRRDPRPGGLVLDSHLLFEGIFLETVN